jgi:hypothetical protein
MALYPERRWFGGAIPIVFHWVLAGYVFLWSRYNVGSRDNLCRRYNTKGSAGVKPGKGSAHR